MPMHALLAAEGIAIVGAIVTSRARRLQQLNRGSLRFWPCFALWTLPSLREVRHSDVLRPPPRWLRDRHRRAVRFTFKAACARSPTTTSAQTI
jgi:hypothetical protein